jgi:acyl CoA:acetate/3-ketoacid CoA transferase
MLTNGNITMEEESLLCDQRNVAASAKSSGGIVIAQVKQLAAEGSLNAREIVVPAPLVDCVVVVDEKDHAEKHGMSYIIKTAVHESLEAFFFRCWRRQPVPCILVGPT